MSGRKLAIRKVRRYRGAWYPSRHREAKRGGPLRGRVLRAAAAPAAALGIGAVGGACDSGLTLAGIDHDAADAVDTAVEDVIPEAPSDVPGEVPADVAAPDDAGVEDVAADESTDEGEDGTADEAADEATDEGRDEGPFPGDMPAGWHYTVYLREAEGRAVIRGVIREETGSPTDPCAHPTLDERIVDDLDYRLGDCGSDVDTGSANVDLLAPETSVEWAPPCPGGMRAAVGFEFLTDEAGDDEDVSGDPAGLTDGEEAWLVRNRECGEAAVSALRATDYPYEVWEYDDGTIDDSDRRRAEGLLGDTVRAIIDDLKDEGFI
jgi:hypothetical protein